MGSLKILIFISSLLSVLCCGRQKAPHACRGIDSKSQCAILYKDHDCHGKAIGISEDDDQLDELIRSAVVKRNCILTLYSTRGSYMATVTGVKYNLASMPNYKLSFETDPNPKHTHGYMLNGRGNRNKRGIRNKRQFGYGAALGLSGGLGSSPSYMHWTVKSLTCSCNKHNGCPNPSFLEPMTKARKPMCALLYAHATDDPNTSCFGRSVEAYNGERASKFEDERLDDEISAIVVRDGCTFTGYRYNNFEGGRKDFKGVTAKLSAMNNKIRSYICQCEIPAIDCTPSEKLKRVKTCGNPDGAEMTCTFWVVYGKTTGSTSSTEYGVTQNLELKEIFMTGFTSSTAYNWATSTAFSKTESVETRYKVDFTVPPGKTYALYQLWGECGQMDVRTMHFEVRNERTAEVIESPSPVKVIE